MKSSLWENEKIRVWNVEGTLSDLWIRTKEPECIDYSFYSVFSPESTRDTLINRDVHQIISYFF